MAGNKNIVQGVFNQSKQNHAPDATGQQGLGEGCECAVSNAIKQTVPDLTGSLTLKLT